MKVKHMLILAVVFVVYVITLYKLLHKDNTAARSNKAEDIPNECEYLHVKLSPVTQLAEVAPIPSRQRIIFDSLRNKEKTFS